ncbi:MAG TPA: DUF2325 domain-containing protein [Terriglobales bacterium]|nr:DUF2325 domain-containing protein [Terriglobales bacterium]
MTVVILGGLDRFKHRYEALAAAEGINLRVFPGRIRNLSCKLSGADAIIMFTDLVSHSTAKTVYHHARCQNKNLICSHKSSLSAAKHCLEQALKRNND